MGVEDDLQTRAKEISMQTRLTGTKVSLEIHTAVDMARRVDVWNPAQGLSITGLGS